MEQALSYDDVLLVPQRSPVDTRSNVKLNSEIGGVELERPFISAPMDTVTEEELAQAMADSGGIGFLHRFMSIEEQVEQVKSVDGKVGGTVGVEEPYVKNAKRLHDAGADIVCLDIAHGHLERCISAAREISNEHPEITLCVGNVATSEGVYDLIEAGADIVKVGIGSGSHCLTREVTGVGVPQFTAIEYAVEGRAQAASEGIIESEDVGIIADGGIQNSGDISKALMAGADAIMAGGLFMGCKETPAETVTIDGEKYKKTRGMASEEAREEREGGEETTKAGAVEGIEGYTRYNGTVREKMEELSDGVSSSLSYCGGNTIPQARKNATFVRVTNSTVIRNGVHGAVEDVRSDY